MRLGLGDDWAAKPRRHLQSGVAALLPFGVAWQYSTITDGAQQARQGDRGDVSITV
jgi:hypothetical protein